MQLPRPPSEIFEPPIHPRTSGGHFSPPVRPPSHLLPVEAAVQRDAADGLLPPLFPGQRLDYETGGWDEPRPTAAPTAQEGSPSLFIGNIPRAMTQALLKELCVQFGPLDASLSSAVRLLKDPQTGLSRGIGFCDYADAASARYAMALLHDLSVGGQRLRVNPAGGDGASPRGGGASNGRAGPSPVAAPPFVRPEWSSRGDAPSERRHPDDDEGGGRRRARDDRRDRYDYDDRRDRYDYDDRRDRQDYDDRDRRRRRRSDSRSRSRSPPAPRRRRFSEDDSGR